MIISIVVDYSRSRALHRVAKKYNSQALEADALHFSTDILSSSVVILGLICVAFGYDYADPIAALFVAVIVLWISYRLGKKSFDVLVDRAPDGLGKEITLIVSRFPQVLDFHNLRTRQSGAQTFIEFNIHVDKNMSIGEAHEITHIVERAIMEKISGATVLIHPEPDGSSD